MHKHAPHDGGCTDPHAPAPPVLPRRRVLQGMVVGGVLLAGGAPSGRGWPGARAAFADGPGDDVGRHAFDCDGMGEDAGFRAAALDSYAAAEAEFSGAMPRVQVVPPTIVTRAEWGADESWRTATRSFAPIRKAVVHHTASSSNPANPASAVREAYRWHTEGREWSDVGYNFLIDHRGAVYEGRWARDYAPGEVHDGEDVNGLGVVGAHASGWNTGTVGICLVGTFIDAPPTEAALASLVHVLAWKLGTRGIDPLGSDPFTTFAGQTVTIPNIVGHRDVGSTVCPGGQLHALLPTLRQRVRARLNVGLIGYRVFSVDGTIQSFGGAVDGGDPRRSGARTPGVAIAPGATAEQYYALTEDGGIFAYGGAPFLGSLPGLRVRNRAVDLAVTGTGRGYWILGADGGVFSFGDATFHGSVPGVGVRTQALKLQATPGGRGYWVLGADGGIFAFGDARFYGSLPGIGVRTPVVDLAPTPTGRGYWILGADGGVFSFGDATFFGSIPGLRIPWSRPAVSLLASTSGYHVLAGDGGVFSFGSVPFYGSTAGSGRRPVGMAPAIA